MSGRDPHQADRVATPLELLFDLTFVIAFGVAAAQLAHATVAHHVVAGLAGFGFAAIAVCWAWINFSWFASAYDTDDWVYRLMTMVQMVGVLILALGIPPAVSSIVEGRHVDNRVLVGGYVVMRVAMVGQWLRAARQDPGRRRACLTYAVAITVAQIGWIGVMVADTRVAVTLGLFVVMFTIELMGPVIAERRMGGTPWHAHHIAERYGLLAIIALGEGVVGAVASLSAVVTEHGWTLNTVLVAAAGTGLTFGMWWLYFVVPFGDLLHARRDRSFWFGYAHIAVFAAIVATGAGLHVAGYAIEGESQLGAAATVLAVAVPVGIYIGTLFGVYTAVAGAVDGFYALLAGVAGSVLAVAVRLAAAGVSMGWCLVIVAGAPAVLVIGYELHGHRRLAAVLARH